MSIKGLLKHKTAIVIAAIVLAGGGWYFYKRATTAPAPPRYVTAAVQKGAIVVSITGTGQVSASNQLDLKPKASGDVIAVKVTPGQSVKKGDVLVQLDATDALKAVRDAQVSLDSAKLSFAKLKEPADQLSILQAQNALSQATESKQTAQDDLTKSYDDAYTDVANTFLDLPDAMAGLQDILYGSTLTKGAQSNIDAYADAVRLLDPTVDKYRNDAVASYAAARAAYDANFSDYKSSSRSGDRAAVDNLLAETYATSRTVADALKNANNLIQFYQDKLTGHNQTPSPVSTTHLSDLNSFTGQVNGHITTLLSVQNTIQNDKDAIVNADRSIAEKTASLTKLQGGPDALDIQSSQLSVEQRQNALADAQEKLADYTIRAPFDGVAAKVDVKVGDPASSGAAVVTMITTQQTSDISLNEVDVAKVAVGQKATLTFDAVPDLTIVGDVVQIDSIGTVSQGVVTYDVKIGFETQDDRVKPGMSTTAAIITKQKSDVLVVPNSAVKTQNGASVVEVVDNATDASGAAGIVLASPPRSVTVQTGLVNDSSTEITGGLTEGQFIVTRVIQATTTATPATTSAIRIPGAGGFGGGGFRGGN